uniref:Uncharacterized protein n=1 Tax=Otus sunia TaxID=257818 RepID=A0A8C8ANP2_9STRI
MALAYGSLVLMALLPIFFGALRSVSCAKSKNSSEMPETITSRDAARFPIVASCTLLGLYLFFKVSEWRWRAGAGACPPPACSGAPEVGLTPFLAYPSWGPLVLGACKAARLELFSVTTPGDVNSRLNCHSLGDEVGLNEIV